jgi:superkiller protein 3
MTLDPLEQLDLSELPDYDADAEYEALRRALRRQQGFGLIFVRCSPSRGSKLIAELKQDLPKKRCVELTLTEPLKDGDFFGYATTFLAEHPADIIFVQGMEHSLLDYEETKRQSGWTKAEIQNYSWKDVPPILRNLNQQRDRFRNELPVCFVFLVPLFLVKYLTRRAPDFFDWRSGVFELQDDDAALERQVEDCRVEDPNDIKELSESERIQRALEIKDLLESLEIQPEQRFRLLYDLGLIQAENGDTRSSEFSWHKACWINVIEAENLYLKGNALGRLGRYEEAITSYKNALSMQSDYHSAWNNRGLALKNLGRYEEAIASYDKAIEIQPDYRSAWNNRGIALKNLGRYEEAIDSYDKALEIQPDSHFAWNQRSNALGNLGRYEEALASCDKALEIQPDSHSALCNRGLALGSLGRYEEAITNYDKAHEIKPDYELAQNNRRKALKKLRSPLRWITFRLQGWLGN